MITVHRIFSILILLVAISISAVGFCFPEISSKGNSQLIEHTVDDRQLTVYLPPDYDSTQQHKLVCFHDGQHLFTEIWNLQPILDALHKKQKIVPTIVVGIHNTGSRKNDLLPYMDPWIVEQWGAYQPEADRFSEFIKNKVVPFIADQYTISDQPGDHALFGASFGGLHALWEAGNSPGYWGMVAAFSPSCWVLDQEIFTTIGQSKIDQTRIWYDIGATTGEWNYYVPLLDALVNKGLEYGTDLFYYEVPDGRHVAEDWAARVHMPLLIFAGAAVAEVKSWSIEIAYIPSEQSVRIFRRINPILERADGVKYSASTQATYTLLNPEAGTVETDGRFEHNGTTPLKVRVEYLNFKKVIKISPRK